MSYNFLNKVAVVTGGLSGIGRSTTIKLLRQGAKVIIGDLAHEQEIDSILNTINKSAPDCDVHHNLRFLRTNIGVYQDNINLVDFALDEYKTIDYVVANAVTIMKGFTATAAEETTEDFNRVINVNLGGIFALNKLCINYWKEFNYRGSIVNIGSISGPKVIEPGSLGLSCGKSGIHTLTRSMAKDYGALGIRINEVCPGLIKTQSLESFLQSGQYGYDQVVAQCPVKRIGDSDEVANAVCFLLSDEASYITGASLNVDGGYSCR
ncbi:hypothetical protein CANMA_003438 [Candida margitis]|uniref:uncharacterized protein n=1 Tax=Candida margitis TaxID=1775924 RepID=UPI00222667DB|nr:uncharacterized protein CANMA_003438 [Candida margitis]KAI5964928.1 hypothetical protein CANMA_003438 [Candida margitis]